MIDFRKILILVLTVIFFSVLLFFYKDHILSTRFVDEEEYLASGKYILRGEKLYDDLITNHQPLAYIFSSAIQKVTQPPNMYKMIVNHRLAIFGWDFFWSVALAFYFSPVGLVFPIVYETSKFYLFGNLFLPESLVVYPLIFLAGLATKKGKSGPAEILFSGILLGIDAFLLGPIWPALFLATALLMKKAVNKQSAAFLFLGFLCIFAACFLFSSLPGYINYYLVDNLKYTVPNYHQAYYSEPWVLTIIKSFLTPVLGFTGNTTTVTAQIIKVFSLAFLADLIFLIRRKKTEEALTVVVLLGLTNIHFVSPGTEHYSAGFLPWYGLFLFLTLTLSFKNILLTNARVFKAAIIMIFLTGIFFSLQGSNPFLFQHRNPMRDFSLNYSTFEDRGRAVKIMSSEGDRIFVSPDDWLIYWESDINHIPKLYGYYAWMSGIPGLHRRILEAFNKNPPEFFYCDNCKGLDLEKYLSKYVRLKQYGGETNLFVLQNK